MSSGGGEVCRLLCDGACMSSGGERYADYCVLEHDGRGNGSVLVWTGMLYNQRTNLIILHHIKTGS